MSRALILVGAVICWLHGPAASAQDPLIEGSSEPLEVQVSFVGAGQAELVHWTQVFEKPGSQFVRLHITDVVNAQKTPVQLLIRDNNGVIVAQYSGSDLAKQENLWTPIIHGGMARIEVVAQSPPIGFAFRIDRIAFQLTPAALYSVVQPDEREPIAAYSGVPQLSVRERAIGKLQFVANGVPKTCSGFLVSESLFMTNEHCIANAADCKSAVATFGYQYSLENVLQLGTQYQCSEFIHADKKLDFALIALAGNPGGAWGTLRLSDRLANPGEQSFLIQHPAGVPKQISRKGCHVSAVKVQGNGQETDVAHVCDTARGSSGSPLLGFDHDVIALHHFGFEQNTPWSNVNRAVRMDLILEVLADHVPDYMDR